jgi:TonB family protein
MKSFLAVLIFVCAATTWAQTTQAPPIQGGIPPAAAPGVKRIQIGGEVQQGKLVTSVPPVYPPLARQARIQGTVRLQIVVARDGTVQEVNVLSGHPLLVQAAIDAVRQWRYQPILLNGEPVEVLSTVDVVYTLSPPPKEPEIDPALHSEILRLLDVMGAKKAALQFADSMGQNLVPLLAKSLPPGERNDQIAAALIRKLRAKMDSNEFMERIVPVYARHFSLEEIRKLIEFYETPAGKHFVEALPRVMLEGNAIGEQWAREIMPEVMKQLADEFPELRKP